MKPIKIIYLMYEATSSTYAESYFIPLIEGTAKRNDVVLFIRVTEKSGSDKITITRRSERFLLIDAPIGMFNCSKVQTLRQVIRNSFPDEKEIHSLVIARGINIFWSCFILGLLKRGKSHFVYDSDGLSADEAIEFRRSLKSLTRYLPARLMEACLLWRADLVLTRSEFTKAVLQKRMPIVRNRPYVELNNGCDPSKYSEANLIGKTNTRRELGISAADTVFVYLGSYGPQYEFEKMLHVFSNIHIMNSQTKLMILVPSKDVTAVRDLVEKYDIDVNSYLVRNVKHDETPLLLAASDFGFSLRQESFSMKHVKPLKTREYLFCGLSVIYSKFTGDDAGIPRQIGFVLQGTSDREFKDLVNWINERMLSQDYFCTLAKRFAFTNFSIDKDVSLLSEAIHNLMQEVHS